MRSDETLLWLGHPLTDHRIPLARGHTAARFLPLIAPCGILLAIWGLSALNMAHSTPDRSMAEVLGTLIGASVTCMILIALLLSLGLRWFRERQRSATTYVLTNQRAIVQRHWPGASRSEFPLHSVKTGRLGLSLSYVDGPPPAVAFWRRRVRLGRGLLEIDLGYRYRGFLDCPDSSQIMEHLYDLGVTISPQ